MVLQSYCIVTPNPAPNLQYLWIWAIKNKSWESCCVPNSKVKENASFGNTIICRTDTSQGMIYCKGFQTTVPCSFLMKSRRPASSPATGARQASFAVISFSFSSSSFSFSSPSFVGSSVINYKLMENLDFNWCFKQGILWIRTTKTDLQRSHSVFDILEWPYSVNSSW